MNFDKELEQLIQEEEIPEKLAVPLLCSKYGGFSKIEKERPYCKVTYDCLYKDNDTKRCYSLKHRRI